MLMDEAINRGYATVNPARRLHIEKSAPEKVPWSEFEVEQVANALALRFIKRCACGNHRSRCPGLIFVGELLITRPTV